MNAPLPSHIGKYLIQRELGHGAMGAVYEGFDPVIERRVAIKTILSQYLADEAAGAAVQRFKREAQAGGRLQHPGIVAVYEYGEDDGLAFIVMEYMEGEDLRQLMRRRGRLDLLDVYGLTRQLLMALDHSHRQGVVHRDLKPANLMVLPGPKLKIMDFGIARLHSSSLTQLGSVLGTPTHMAPEQLAGHPADGRADLWAAGVILYELLTGHQPFAAESPAAVMHKVLNSEPALPTSLDARIAPAFDAVVARALAKRPEARFQTAAEFAQALLAAYRGKPAAVAVPPAPTAAESTLSPDQTARYERTGTVSAGAESQPLSATLPAQTLAEIEASLTRSIGPLAKQLVRQSAAQARSVDEFYATLADTVPAGPERDAFLARIRRLDPGRSGTHAPAPAAATGPPSARVAFDAATLTRCEQQLARHIGPLARVLIKRAANDSGNVAELYRKLAEHIDTEPERQAFLDALR